MAARNLWTGTISFGLVSVPVRMNTAVSEQTVRFNQINRHTGARIRQLKVDASTNEPVEAEDIVKGYPISKDNYVLIEPDEVKALHPAGDKTLSLEQFVDQAEIDPLVYNTSYYFLPDEGGLKPYGLLVEAMAQSNRVAIGKFIYAGRERLVALRAKDGVLIGATLIFADEINEPATPEVALPSGKELDMAKMLIETLTGEFDHSAYTDEYREQVMALIEAKAAGQELPSAPEQADSGPAPDLMAGLEASLAALGKPKSKAKTTTKKEKVTA